jgi:1,4-dihydroxy-2-naphthoate octaprenyltransferase
VALLLQIGANLANDLSDFRRGVDTPARMGPVRVAAAGLVTERQLEVAIALTLGLAIVDGLWLASVGGPLLLGVGAAAIVAAIAYSGGPLRYGYRGLGELFVFVFFGLVSVAGTAYLQTGVIHPLFIAAAVPVGALITAILVVNNLRDIPGDAAAGKRTLAVVLGARGPTLEYGALVAIAFLVPIALAAAGVGPAGPAPAPRGAARVSALAHRPQLHRAARAQRRLKATARLSLIFGILFAVGLAIAGAMR